MNTSKSVFDSDEYNNIQSFLNIDHNKNDISSNEIEASFGFYNDKDWFIPGLSRIDTMNLHNFLNNDPNINKIKQIHSRVYIITAMNNLKPDEKNLRYIEIYHPKTKEIIESYVEEKKTNKSKKLELMNHGMQFR